jgi:hypothetical protein
MQRSFLPEEEHPTAVTKAPTPHLHAPSLNTYEASETVHSIGTYYRYLARPRAALLCKISGRIEPRYLSERRGPMHTRDLQLEVDI